MTIDVNSLGIYTYFLIILSGFGFVWSYRKGKWNPKPISDFEYAGFSAIWGVIILGFYSWLMRNKLESLNNLLSNPYTAGVVLFVFGVVLGFGIRFIINQIKSLFK
jgi:hypothetical protein